MYNLTLVFTRHKEIGFCNSTELFKIIETVEPEIIFEELSNSNYDKVYSERSLVTLESNAIKKYMQNQSIEHIPVDTYDLPISYYDNLSYMIDRMIKSNMKESHDLRILLDNQASLMSRYGFKYLNSDQNDDCIEQINVLKKRILNILNDEYLFQIASLEQEVTVKREDEIIENIYNFSKDYLYYQALLFIGSGHRRSIIRKIEERNTLEKTKINWKFYST